MEYIKKVQAQLDRILEGNKRLLERIPEDKLDWKPHEKSMSVGELAEHLATLPAWMNRISEADVFDFKDMSAPQGATTKQQLLDQWRQSADQAKAALAKVPNVNMEANWEMRANGAPYRQMPRHVAYAEQLEHMVHHSGQLGVYLRLLGQPVPGLYGPSADDREAQAKAATAQA